MGTLEERFSEFYQKWVLKMQHILNELLQVTRNRNEVVMNDFELLALVSKVTSHISEFYTAKWAEAHVNCIPFFYPVWMTPFENSYLWVSGFKPSAMVFRLMDSMRTPRATVEGLAPPPFLVTMAQGMKIEVMRIRNWMDEEMVDREMERILNSIADWKIPELVKIAMQMTDGNLSAVSMARVDALVELAMKRVMSEFENAMKGADCVRLRSLYGVLNVLRPMQCVEFLATFINLELHLSQWGKARLRDENGDASDATAVI